MNEQKVIRLSSRWTNVFLYFLGFLVLFMTFVYILIVVTQEFHGGFIVAGCILVLLISYVVYQFLYMCHAKIIDDKLVLKKSFRPAKSYLFKKIVYVNSFELRTTKFITVEMANEDGTTEKYIILNSNSFLSFENIDAEELLLQLQNS